MSADSLETPLPPAATAVERLIRTVVHLACLATVVLVAIAAGQPIFTEDTWWHVAIGDVYLGSGPWLSADPFLFAAESPPAPAAWLTDVVLQLVQRLAGFQGLRVVHVALVCWIVLLAWSLLRKASGSAVFASLGAATFAAHSAYRLFQLRPHLVSILAGLLLVRLLVVDGRPPTRARIAGAALLMGLWANAHGAFVLGPVLLGAAMGGVLLGALTSKIDAAQQWMRLRRLGAALGLGLLATLLNPMGLGMHMLYFAAGKETPELAVVADEWARVSLFELPLPNLPPSPLSWAIAWGLVLATPVAAWLLVQALRSSPREGGRRDAPDPALITLGLVSLIGMLAAVRLSWLSIFPLMLVGAALRSRPSPSGASLRAALVAALLALALVPAFMRLGDWPMISKGVHRAWYARPYNATKFHAHAVWFMRDAGLEGRLFNDYSTGNFLSYWVTPELPVLINGSLNVPIDVMNASRALTARQGTPDGRSFLQLLDELGVDVFFGVGTPWVPLPGRAATNTTTHLEHAPGWTLAFRNMRCAVYVRAGERGRRNLERVARYYQAEGVPFDPERGFDLDAATRRALPWTIEHGAMPVDVVQLSAATRSPQPETRHRAMDQLAATWAVAGLYDRSIEFDRQLLRSDPNSVRAARRIVWSLLHLRRTAESLAASDELERIAPPSDVLSRAIVATARRAAGRPEEEIAALVARLPVLERPEGHQVYSGFREPTPRPR